MHELFDFATLGLELAIGFVQVLELIHNVWVVELPFFVLLNLVDDSQVVLQRRNSPTLTQSTGLHSFLVSLFGFFVDLPVFCKSFQLGFFIVGFVLRG